MTNIMETIISFFNIFSLLPLFVLADNILHLGFLKHRKYPQVLGAVSLAVQRINNDSTILPRTKLEFQFADLPRKY